MSKRATKLLPIREVILLGHAALAATTGGSKPLNGAVAVDRIAEYVAAVQGWEQFITPGSSERALPDGVTAKQLRELANLHSEVLRLALNLLVETRAELGETRKRGTRLRAYVQSAGAKTRVPAKGRSRRKI